MLIWCYWLLCCNVSCYGVVRICAWFALGFAIAGVLCFGVMCFVWLCCFARVFVCFGFAWWCCVLLIVLACCLLCLMCLLFGFDVFVTCLLGVCYLVDIVILVLLWFLFSVQI